MEVGYLDTYLLHWRGSIPLEEMVEEMERLVEKGKIKSWGVSKSKEGVEMLNEIYHKPTKKHIYYFCGSIQKVA